MTTKDKNVRDLMTVLLVLEQDMVDHLNAIDSEVERLRILQKTTKGEQGRRARELESFQSTQVYRLWYQLVGLIKAYSDVCVCAPGFSVWTYPLPSNLTSQNVASRIEKTHRTIQPILAHHEN